MHSVYQNMTLALKYKGQGPPPIAIDGLSKDDLVF